MLGILFSSLPHIFIGAMIASILMIKNKDSSKKRILMLVFCSVVVLSPDVLKILGFSSSHALWLCPILGIFFSFLYAFLIKKENSFMDWIKFSIIILIGHLFIDYIGNGARLLYPFVKEEFIFSIISKLDFVFIVFLAIFLIIVFMYPKKKESVLVCLIIITMYFSFLTLSKIQLEYSLKEKYKSEDIVLLISYPNDSLHWGYQLRTTSLIVTGESPVFSKEINVETKREIN